MMNRINRVARNLSVAAILIYLTAGTARFDAPFRTGDLPITSSSLPALQGEKAIQRLKEEGLYSSLQKAVEATRYEIRWEEQPALNHLPPSYHAPNPAQRFNVYFMSNGLQLAPHRASREATAMQLVSDQAEWRAEMKLIGYGYGERPLAVGPAKLVAVDNRIEYRRTGLALTEWYVNKAEGLEQGFTIDAPPGIKPQGERLRLVLELSGDLRAEMTEEGRAIALKQANGQVALRYSDLHSFDAEGQVLPSEMKVSDGRVILEVEDAGAIYPVTIDPVFNQQQKLMASDAGDDDQFGSSVAISGSTAVVGAEYYGNGSISDQGAAYVFIRSGTIWSEQQKLTAHDAAALQGFGTSVAISGETIVIGASGVSIGSNSSQGAAYVFVRSGTTWSEQWQLIASDGAAHDNFGISVGISGDTVVAGAFSDLPNNNQGAAYVFVRSGTTWSQQQKLVASDGAEDDRFGLSVAISNNTVVVGAYRDDIGLNFNQGSAYVFVRSGTTWSEQQKLTTGDGEGSDQFGYSVAISGDTLVVGAERDDVGSNVDQGSVYIFVRSGTTWSQQQKLTASDGAPDDRLGRSVAISGGLVVAGTWDDVGSNVDQGSAYVFARSGTTWTQQHKLTASDGAAGDWFGSSVAISSDTVLVGAQTDDLTSITASNQGSVYMFATWGQRQKLTADDGTAYDQFGYSVAISGTTAVVGAWRDDIGSRINQGSAYVFVRSGSSWSQQAKLIAGDGATGDAFGYSVAIHKETVVVGASRDDIDSKVDQGSAYVFVRNPLVTPIWSEQAKLTGFKGSASDLFGQSVAISEDTVVVGAPWDDIDSRVDQGSAHVFWRSGTSWSQPAGLSAGDGAAGDEFGSSVAISEDMIIVGAPWDDIGTNVNQGSAYFFWGSRTFWSQKQKITAGDGSAFDLFGCSLAISDDTVVIGAFFDSWQGSAYVFVLSGATWSQQAKLTGSDTAGGDSFGSSVAISDDTVVIGAPGDDIGSNTDQGSVYVFVRSGTSWSQQQKLTTSDGAAGDDFGSSVTIDKNGVLAGAPGDSIGLNAERGSVYVFVR